MLRITEMAQEKEADQSDLAEAMGALMDRQPGARVGVNGRGALPQDEADVHHWHERLVADG
jgi:hypothetical protein